MKTIEEQLAEANATVARLEADAKANADLLTEAQGKVAAAEKLAEDRKTQLEAKTAEFDALTENFKAEIEAKTAEIKQAKTAESGKVAELTAEVERLKAEAKTAEQIAAERYSAGGPPAQVPAPGQQSDATDALVAKFKAISDPTEQTRFWQGLTSAQKSAIVQALNA